MAESMAKAGLLDWVRRERACWELLLAEVGEARMNMPGAMGDWTFKDLLCHLTAWQRLAQAPLEHALTGVSHDPPWPPDLNPERDQRTINQCIYDETHRRSPAEAIREARQVWDRLEEGIHACAEGDLTASTPDGETFGAKVVREATAHYHQDHEAAVRAWLAGFCAPADEA